MVKMVVSMETSMVEKTSGRCILSLERKREGVIDGVSKHCDVFQDCHLVVLFYDYNVWPSVSSVCMLLIYMYVCVCFF